MQTLPKQHPTGKRTTYFYNAVKEALPRYFSSKYIHMVKGGHRKNDEILLTVIVVDHFWDTETEFKKIAQTAIEVYHRKRKFADA
jgi:hypothetical protein